MFLGACLVLIFWSARSCFCLQPSGVSDSFPDGPLAKLPGEAVEQVPGRVPCSAPARRLSSAAEGCHCTGNNTQVVNEVNLNYGTYCAPWDSVEQYCAPEGEHFGADWCEESWCYVPQHCGLPAVRYTNTSLYYSTEVCVLPPPPPSPLALVCEVLLDNITTCGSDSKVHDNFATKDLNDSPTRCCQFCRDNYPEARYSDYWYNVPTDGYCNCYASCDVTREVSVNTMGSYGDNIITSLIPASLVPPPSPLPPPPPQPEGPTLPPAPPYLTDGGVVYITAAEPNHAAQHLREALADSTVETVLLSTIVSFKEEGLPSVDRSLSIIGRNCSQEAGASRCVISAEPGFSSRFFTVSKGGRLHLENLTLRGANVASSGGAVQLTDSAATLRNCVLESNTADAVTGGGAVHCDNCSLRIEGGNFTDNRAGDSGGALWVTRGSHVEISESYFTINYGLNGAGILMIESSSHVEIRNTYMFRNTCDGSGCGISAWDDCSLSLSNVSLLNSSQGFLGGGIFALGTSLNISNSEIMFNSAAERGAGVYLHYGVEAVIGPNVTIAHNELVDNQGILGGGGVAVYEGSSLYLFHSAIRMNTALTSPGGGLLAVKLAQIRVEDSLISWNQGGNGGGVSVQGGVALNMARAELHANRANDDGGGLHIGSEDTTESEVALREVVISENSAETGGGIYSSSKLAVISSSEVVANVAGYGGGAYVATGCALHLAAAVAVKNNSAQWYGGGLYSEEDGTLEVNESLVHGSDSEYGGAAYVGMGGTLRVFRSEMAHNRGRSSGGAVHAADWSVVHISAGCALNSNNGYLGGGVYISTYGSLTIDGNSSVQSNHATNGGGVYGVHSSLDLRASIVSGNEARGE
ncbi:hypothetical protein CYMTET_12427, partial [Cymbomonas tetramitiformis]